MTNIPAARTQANPDYELTWTPITEADTPVKSPIRGGRYTVVVEGAFGGGSIAIAYAKLDVTTPRNLDATNLVFTANGQYNIEIGSGFILPVRTGGTSMSVTVSLIPIP